MRNYRRGWRGLGDSSGAMQQGGQYVFSFSGRISPLADGPSIAGTIVGSDSRYSLPTVTITSHDYLKGVGTVTVGFTWAASDSSTLASAGAQLASIINSKIGFGIQFQQGSQVGGTPAPANQPYRDSSGNVVLPAGWTMDNTGAIYAPDGSIYDDAGDLPTAAGSYTPPGATPGANQNQPNSPIPWSDLLVIGGVLAGVWIVVNA